MSKIYGSIIALLLFILAQNPADVSAQQKIVGKVVSSSSNQPVSGASILVKGKNIGTSTTVDGNFSIAAQRGDVLLVTGVGVKEKAFDIANTVFQLLTVDVEPSQ